MRKLSWFGVLGVLLAGPTWAQEPAAPAVEAPAVEAPAAPAEAPAAPAAEPPAAAPVEAPVAAPTPVSFSKEVAPLLIKHCQACHGPSDPKGEFQLATFTALLKPGASTADSIVAGKPEESELIRLVTSEDVGERMPKDADPLAPAEVELLKRWVQEGAAFDGPDVNAALASFAPKPPHPAAPAVYPRTIPVTALAFRPDGQELAVGGYNEVLIYNPADGALLRRIADVERRIHALAYNPEGTLLAVAGGKPGETGEVRLVDPATGTLVRTLGTMSDEAFGVAFNPAGTRLAACAADRSIRIYDVASGNQELLIEDHADWVMGIAWNHDGTRLASASRDKTSKVFDTATGDSLITYPGHGEPVFGVAWSADGTQVLTGGANKMIHVWNPADAAKIGEIGGFGGDVNDLLCRQTHIYCCAADNSVKQFQTADRAEVRSFAGNTDWVYSLALNEPSGRLASGCFNGEVRVWNVADGAAVSTFKAAPGVP